HRLTKERGRGRQELAGGRDDGGHAAVGAAHQRHAVLDGAGESLIKVLVGGRGGTEPRVVRDVDDEVGAQVDEPAGQPGEEDLVADLRRDAAAVGGNDLDLVARCHVADAGGAAQRGK